MTKTRLTIRFFVYLLFVGAWLPVHADGDEPHRVCEFGDVTLSSDFSAGRMNACEKLNEGHYAITIDPEDTPPINGSPWYAFSVKSQDEKSITLDIKYSHFRHRYWPKVSVNGAGWHRLAQENFQLLEDGGARLSLSIGPNPLLVAGQEILTSEFHNDWTKGLAIAQSLDLTVSGQSRQGRDILKTEAAAGNGDRDYIFLVGRQHPPEITGALGLISFVETIYDNTELAARFRENFGIILVPMLNPDGVEAGHWRHGMGSKDLNRDWGPFTDPETALMRDELDRFDGDDRLWLFLDFHSTRPNVLYTQAESEVTNPPLFAVKWTDQVKARLKDYEFERDERPVSELPTSKNYVYTRFGVPSITYEVGDETDRAVLANAARVFAEEMMKILLDAKASEGN